MRHVVDSDYAAATARDTGARMIDEAAGESGGMPEREDSSLSSRYFDDVYAASDDPWQFATSAYEAEKYATTIDMLGREPYGRGFEIGCSIGVLSRLLAGRCASLLSVDISERALAAARERCRDLAHVAFARMNVPHDMAEGPFDLVVVSEVAYYWSDADLALARERIAAYGTGTTLELVHFLPRVDDYKRDGDAVHAAFLADDRYEPVRARRAERYRIDVLRVR